MRKNSREIRNYEYMEYGVYGPAAESDREEKRTRGNAKRNPALEKMMLGLGGVLIAGLMVGLFGDSFQNFPESVSVVGWTVLSFIVAGFASVGM